MQKAVAMMLRTLPGLPSRPTLWTVGAGGVLLAGVGIFACVHALGVLVGRFPEGKLPPYPAWVAVHFLCALGFVGLVPLQLWPALRRRWPGLHRATGRLLVAIGLIMGASGLAMAFLSPDRPLSERLFMSVFLAVYLAMLAKGFIAARARDFDAHRDWMIRMIATGLTPMSQRLVFGGLAATNGIDGLATFWELFVSAAWIALVINVAAAEWLVASLQRRVARGAAARAAIG